MSASALNGSVTINADSTLSYAPDANSSGPDTISDTITDNGASNGAADPKTSSSTVTVTVTEVNDAPTANPDTATVAEDSTGNVINVLANDSKGPANEAGQTLDRKSVVEGKGVGAGSGRGTIRKEAKGD